MAVLETDEFIQIYPLDGYEIELPKLSVIKLNRAINGLKRASWFLNHTLIASVNMVGLKRIKSDEFDYDFEELFGMEYVLLYVDEILLIGKENVTNNLRVALMDFFKMK